MSLPVWLGTGDSPIAQYDGQLGVGRFDTQPWDMQIS